MIHISYNARCYDSLDEALQVVANMSSLVYTRLSAQVPLPPLQTLPEFISLEIYLERKDFERLATLVPAIIEKLDRSQLQ